MPAHRKDTAAAFNALWIPEPNSGCWLWLGGVDRGGYGMFWYDGATRRATHFSLRENKGIIVPRGMMALHSCDNPGCVNDEHLFVGAAVDNAADAKRKRRHSHGLTHGRRKLSEDEVREIRASPLSDRKMAAAIGMHRDTVSKIRLRKLWGHLS